jgi:hypothetical protein
MSLQLDGGVTTTVAHGGQLSSNEVPLDPSVKRAGYAVVEVEDYRVVDGLAVAHTWGRVDGSPLVSLAPRVDDGGGFQDGLVDYGTWLDPLEVDLGATARWVPRAGSFDGIDWSPSVGNLDLRAGLSPLLDTSYAYVRRGERVLGSAVRLADGDHLWTDGASWASEQVTVLAVVVLHQPEGQWFPVLALGPADGVGSTVGLHYTAYGTVEVHTGSLRGEHQLAMPAASAGRPVVVGLSLGAASRSLRTVTVDRSLVLGSHRVEFAPYLDARLWLGRSGVDGGASAWVDVLDVAYWTSSMDDGVLAARANRLGALYGVTL